MTWTDQQKLDYLLRLPWAIVPERTPEGDLLLRTRELPTAVGCGETTDELERDFWEALEATLRSYLHHGDRIPLPSGASATLPWEVDAHAPTPPRAARPAPGGLIDQPSTSATASRPQELPGEPVPVS